MTNANGRCPLSASGMPTTQHSAINGCEDMACSMDPKSPLTFLRYGAGSH